MSEFTDKLYSLKSGLTALGSGGRRFEEGSYLCYTYLKNLLCGMSDISSCTGVPDLLEGSSGGWSKSG